MASTRAFMMARAATPSGGAHAPHAVIQRVAGGALIATALTILGCERAPTPDSAPPPKPIAWTEVRPHTGTATRTLPGFLRPVQRAPLSFDVPGRVAAIKVDIGDAFASGDLLARLDRRTFELALDERRSQLAEAQARLVEADHDLERQQELTDQGYASEATLDRARAARETAHSRVATAQARLELAREDLADTRLVAPYAGTVAERLVEPSQRIRSGQTVLRVQGDQRLEVIVAAPETVVDRLEAASRHRVQLPAHPELELTGVIQDIATEASARNAYPVTLRLEDPSRRLRSGLTAEVAFALRTLSPRTASETPLRVIPATAFAAGPGQTRYAMVFDAEAGVVRRRMITLAEISGDRALVRAGLEPGEIIASQGVSFLEDGQRVVRLGVGVRRFNE